MILTHCEPIGLSWKKKTATCWKITAHHVIESMTQQLANKQVSVLFMIEWKTCISHLSSFHCLQFRLRLQLWRGWKASLSDLSTKILLWRFVIFPSHVELCYWTQASCFSYIFVEMQLWTMKDSINNEYPQCFMILLSLGKATQKIMLKYRVLFCAFRQVFLEHVRAI